MSEMYEAWDGKQYPSPAPEGWSQRPDGRWWPAGHGPSGQGAQATSPHPMDGPAVPLPGAASASHQPSPARPFAAPVGTEKKKGIRTGTLVLVAFLGFIVLSVGGCLFSAVTFFGRAETLIEEGRDEFDAYTAELEAEDAEALSQISLDGSTCQLEGRVARVSGEVNNDGAKQYSYSITIQFTGSDNRRLDPGFAAVNSVAPGETIVFDAEALADDAEDDVRCTVSKVSRSED